MVRSHILRAPSSNGERRSPGRPRSENARRAILHSTLCLLQRIGFPELTIESIAIDAGVSKATVYRWWPNKGALVVDAFASSTESKLHFPDTGSVYQDVALQMQQVIAIFRSRRGKIVAALLGAGRDPRDDRRLSAGLGVHRQGTLVPGVQAVRWSVSRWQSGANEVG